MIDIEKIKAAALSVCSWKLDTAWLDTSEDESAAVVGHIDEDGNDYPVITVDCDLYFQGQDSLPLAKYYAQANPSAVLELITRLEAAERDAAKWQAYQKRKQEVIAAGMGRKIMRDLESHDALPAFYTAMKEKL